MHTHVYTHMHVCKGTHMYTLTCTCVKAHTHTHTLSLSLRMINFISLLFKVWSMAQQHQHNLDVSYKFRLSDPITDMLIMTRP